MHAYVCHIPAPITWTPTTFDAFHTPTLLYTQLRNLYGPLLACVTASACAYDAMIRQHSSDGTRAAFVRAIQQDPHGPAGVAYRHWMRVVFQPLNQRASSIIEDHLGVVGCGVDS